MTVDPELEHRERSVLEEYSLKLVCGDTTVPDPLTLKDGWIGEQNGVIHWPSVYYHDIAAFLKMLGPEFIMRLEREYKLGKAHRYFACSFVREIFHCGISDTSMYCILKCRVIPSQKTSSKPYHVWAIVTKDTTDKPGGKIINAYCTCTAGLMGTCNHVTAMLFRVEAAVTSGLTRPTKTSILSTWNVPTGVKINLKPLPVAEMVFEQSHYTKTSERDLAEAKKTFLDFSPTLIEQQMSSLKDENAMRNRVYSAIKGDIKTSCFAEVMEGKRLSAKEQPVYEVPDNILKVADNFIYNNNLSIEQNVTNFTNKINVTCKQINDLKEATSSQGLSEQWQIQRKGRRTASNFRKVYTRAETLKKNPTESTRALTDLLLGLSKRFDTKALRHGRAMEAHAKRKYVAVVKSKHKNFTSKDVGFIILKAHPYIGASPDLEINCECCGLGLCEIKCPYSILDQVPSASNLPYLTETEDDGVKTTNLIHNTEYYFQVQGQMAISEANYCDFFIFTKHGYHLERICFNANIWKSILNNLTWFWLKYIAPRLIKKDYYEQEVCTSLTGIKITDYSTHIEKSSTYIKSKQKQVNAKTSSIDIKTPPPKQLNETTVVVDLM